MEKIEINITEKDKMGKQLTLFNFRDELINFMYKKTVADSSRTSMRFFVLIFFLSLKVGSKSLLMSLFDDNLEKMKSLNKSFLGKKKLKSGEYAKLVKKNGLDRVFKYDIFFILITTILDSSRVLTKFNNYFLENFEIKNEFIKVIEKHKDNLEEFDLDFKNQLIADDRIDEWGERHDLSKSVYRTIKMRTSRSLDLELHKYAELRVVKSESPIDLTIIQHINPQVITDLWDTYKLGDYVKSVWSFFNDTPLITAIVGTVLADKFLKWKNIDGKKNRNKKLKAKMEFDKAKRDQRQNQKLLQLASVLADSVVKSNDFLQKEIQTLKNKKEIISRAKSSASKNKKIKELKEKIEKLENIEIRVSKKKSKD